MKTAISIPDKIFGEAESVAKRLGMSRSQLYAKALSSFVENNREDSVTEALDRLYATENSSLDLVVLELQKTSLPREEW